MKSRALKTSASVARKLNDIVRQMGGGSVQIGFMENATYPDGTPVAAAMFWLEFGHGGRFPSPPRSFFRTMIAKESPTWPGKMAAEAKASNYNGPLVLALMGEDIQASLYKSLVDLTDPPLSPTTLILRKKFGNDPSGIRITDVLAAQKAVEAGEEGATGTQAKPGIWTGHALNSITYKVMR